MQELCGQSPAGVKKKARLRGAGRAQTGPAYFTKYVFSGGKPLKQTEQ